MDKFRSFRIVCEPALIAQVEDLLLAEGYGFEPEPFSPFCRRLVHEPAPLGSSLAAFFGYIYIQDRASMLPPLALAPAPDASVLDMCASPGGKSGFLAQLVGRNGFVLANEPNPARLGVLRANIGRANLLQAATCSYPGEKLPLFPASWDFILLDPPCSGWGTEDRHPNIRRIWAGHKIETLAALQRRLLRHAASLLAPGASLLYSTCTTNAAEDEEQTRFAETALGLIRVPLVPFPGFVFAERPGGHGCLLVESEKSQAQGFYLSLLRKPEDARQPEVGPGFVAPATAPDFLRSPVCDPSLLPPGACAIFGGCARFLPEAAARMLPATFAWQGFPLGKVHAGLQFFTPDPRLRVLLPHDPAAPRLCLEDAGALKALLAGKGLATGLPGREAALWWRELPLGKIGLKNGRPTACFKAG